ncbi:MAG: KTSC domain-containing protein [Pseudomonadota bacterium]
MELKKIRAGRLRGIGYDEKARVLRIELDNGELLEYDRITLEMWRRFSESTAPWSYYCDNIQDELTPHRATGAASSGAPKKNPLDDLLG